MNLTIILPCASDDGFDDCLGSIDEDVEVVAVLNRPSQRLRERVLARDVTVVEIAERNLGAACQAGCVAASNDHVILMNTDSVFEPGAIRKMVEDWSYDTVVRATLRFAGRGLGTRVIENLQTHHLSHPDRAYQPGLLFHRGLVDQIGGYFFDEDIHWTEDADFDRRVRSAGIGVVVSSAIVQHGKVTVLQKLRSAFRYGVGRAIAELKGLHGTYPHFRPSVAFTLGDWDLLRRRYGRATSVYNVFWTIAFSCGVLAQRHLDVYRINRRLAVR